ncbi:hypothetical protein LOZ80_26055 [Paenibacillus sp. HWE-109]|uniref:hypothetical protein n=1 Tax=Paenibacillus sp. HWE-109 TaxID=1306526 RepID=UPI001EE12FA4|nr:hypothetical protein [Paenibacillus sp. HWE-109]UKS25045.1 hypothetical protein LOZ80_26055 [Paenibacillus sp. HWE-109]
MEVEANLYDFLKTNETHLYTSEFDKNKTVYALVFIPFDELCRFTGIVGSGVFDEEGLEVVMKETYLAVTLNDIIENQGHYISSYKNCFDEDDWNHYEDKIKEMEA